MAANPSPQRRHCQRSRRKKLPRQSVVDGLGQYHEASLPATCCTSSILVVNLPRGIRPGKLRRPLRDCLKSFGLKKLRVASTQTGHCRGYAVADLEKAEIACEHTASSGGIEIDIDGFPHKVVVQLSRCCGGKIDSLFPFVPYSVRQQIRIDSEAMYSTTDQALGAHVAEALRELCAAAGASLEQLGSLDGCGCCGGSALMLLEAFGGPVRAIELDSVRAEILAANLKLFSPDARGVCIHGDFCKLWPTLAPGMGIVFLDVPWGGPSYGESELIEALEFGGMPLTDLILQLAEAEAAPLVVLRLPRNLDTDKMAKELSVRWADWNFRWAPDLSQPERPMPFRFELGSCGTIFALCFCRREPYGYQLDREVLAEDRNFHFLKDGFRLSHLDDLVLALQNWDGERGHRHRVAFFDWEAERWIPLTRWKGCKSGLRACAETCLLKNVEEEERIQGFRFYQTRLHTFGP